MNVLYLTSNPNRTSSNIPTEGWFERLGSKGLRPVLVSQQSGAFGEWVRAQGIPTYEHPLPFPSLSRPIDYARSLWEVRRIARRHDADLIHAIEHTVYPIAGDLAQVTGLPVCVGVHCRLERGFAQWAFKRRRMPDRVYFLTAASREVCREAMNGSVPEARWQLLPNGLNVNRFTPDVRLGQAFRDAHGLGHGPLLGAASWLRPGKQLEHLIRLVDRIEDPHVTLVLAGGAAPGEESYAEGLLAFARGTLGSRFKHVGLLSDLRGFYNALTLMVNTSKEETMSISVMESLASGCPVVGYPSVSVVEQVPSGAGEILAQDDEAALLTATAAWLGEPGRIEQARVVARRWAVEAFDIQTISLRLWDDYQRITSRV